MTSKTYRHRLALAMLTRKQASAEGFTLIELLVVVVILGVLGALGYQAYLDQIARANLGTAQIAAVAAAKNCSALRITSEESSFVTGVVNTNQVTVSPSECDAGEITFEASAGEGGNLRTAEATLRSDGAVTD